MLEALEAPVAVIATQYHGITGDRWKEIDTNMCGGLKIYRTLLWAVG
jgi:hypothetical protein